MSCSSPQLAVVLGKTEEGKSRIKFLGGSVDYNIKKVEDKYGYENVILLPCGQCVGCKLDYRREWSVRCMLESSLYKDNCFITLTYSDLCYPGKSVKKDLQNFIKRLRHKASFRYYACSEAGSNTNRYHFHAILFGYRPKDLKLYSKTKNGDYLYTSKELSDVWKLGHVLVGDVSERSCGYVAGYVGKKLNDTGFVVMSNRPGIGAKWFENHLDSIYSYDNIVLQNGNVVSVPKYCDVLAERLGYNLEEIKAARLEKLRLHRNNEMNAHGYEHFEMTFHDKLEKNIDRGKRLKRNGL